MDIWQADRYDVGSWEAQRALCYPSGEGCAKRVLTLRSIGVSHLISFGGTSLPGLGLRVLGKGHASVVIAGLLDGSLVAIKSRRMDGKRKSLEREGQVLAKAHRIGAAPAPLYWDDDIIVMELVRGPTLLEALRLFPEEAVIESMRAARALDSAMILHQEINRPWKNVVFSGAYRGARALILDYESSGEGCSNVSSLLGGLLIKLGLPLDVLYEALARYKRECTRSSYSELEKLVIQILFKGRSR